MIITLINIKYFFLLKVTVFGNYKLDKSVLNKQHHGEAPVSGTVFIFY